ncbi:MAG: hypothetical protein ICV83_01235 [Cytophagales bacterium]|nr:hypothetical protein [Cytophagales bacterium]
MSITTEYLKVVPYGEVGAAGTLACCGETVTFAEYFLLTMLGRSPLACLLILLTFSLLTTCSKKDIEPAGCKLVTFKQPAVDREYILEYGKNNRVSRMTIANTYHDKGVPERVIGATYSYQYDGRNQLIETVFAIPHPATHTIKHEYDAAGKWVKSVLTGTAYSPEVYTATYDAEGNRTRVDTEYAGKWQSTTVFKYENQDMVEAVVSSATTGQASTIKYEYYPDQENKLRGVEDHLFFFGIYGDPVMNANLSQHMLKKVVWPDGKTSEFSYEYNAQGWPTLRKAINQLLVTYEYKCR